MNIPDPAYSGRSFFWKRIIPTTQQTTDIPISTNNPNFDYLIGYVSSAMFGLLQLWNEQGKDISTDDFSKMMQTLVLHGLSAYIPTV